MEIKKEQDGKWIFPGYGKFLVNASATEDTEKLIALKVFVPLASTGIVSVVTSEWLAKLFGGKVKNE